MIDPEGLARFTAVPGPTGSEEPRIGWLEERLASAGGSLARDEVGNLVWRFGGAPGPPALLLMAHVDTVFAGVDTIDVVRSGDELIGPGVGDNAAAVMAVIWTISALDPVPPGLAVVFTVGEEGLGNLRGSLHACRSLQPAMAIAAEAELLVERRSVDQVELDEFDASIGRFSVEPPLRLECETVGKRPAGRVDRDHPLVRTVVDVQHSLGLPAEFGSGSTDANAAAAFGIPAVSIGCTRGSGMHTLGERIELEPLELGCRQLAAVISALTS